MMNTQIILDQNVLAEITAAAVVGVSDAVHEMIGEKELEAHSANEGAGTKKTGYALPEMGPFECEHCIHVSEKGTRCSHLDVLKDEDVPKTPDQKLAIVDPHACC